MVRRLATIVGGSCLLVVGLALLVLPGPAFIVIPVAILILASELPVVRRLVLRLLDRWQRPPHAVVTLRARLRAAEDAHSA